MTFRRAFELVDAGRGRWNIRLRDSPTVIGSICRSPGGFELADWLDRPVGTFASRHEALDCFLGRGTLAERHLGAA
jgi:hypothetical protein